MKCLKKNDTINLILFFNSTNGGSVLGAKEPGQSFLDKIFRKKDDNVTDEEYRAGGTSTGRAA